MDQQQSGRADIEVGQSALDAARLIVHHAAVVSTFSHHTSPLRGAFCRPTGAPHGAGTDHRHCRLHPATEKFPGDRDVEAALFQLDFARQEFCFTEQSARLVQAPRSPCRLGAGRRQRSPPSRSVRSGVRGDRGQQEAEPHPERVGTIGPYRLIGRITCGLGWYSRREWSANTATIEHWSTLAIVAGNHRCSILPPPVKTGRQTSIGSPMLMRTPQLMLYPSPRAAGGGRRILVPAPVISA